MFHAKKSKIVFWVGFRALAALATDFFTLFFAFSGNMPQCGNFKLSLSNMPQCGNFKLTAGIGNYFNQ